jgi:hypothetical protein
LKKKPKNDAGNVFSVPINALSIEKRRFVETKFQPKARPAMKGSNLLYGNNLSSVISAAKQGLGKSTAGKLNFAANLAKKVSRNTRKRMIKQAKKPGEIAKSQLKKEVSKAPSKIASNKKSKVVTRKPRNNKRINTENKKLEQVKQTKVIRNKVVRKKPTKKIIKKALPKPDQNNNINNKKIEQIQPPNPSFEEEDKLISQKIMKLQSQLEKLQEALQN